MNEIVLVTWIDAQRLELSLQNKLWGEGMKEVGKISYIGMLSEVYLCYDYIKRNFGFCSKAMRN